MLIAHLTNHYLIITSINSSSRMTSHRCNLSSLILQLLTIGIDVKNFEFIDEPPKQSMSSALRQLKQLGAIKTTDNPQLTDIGHKMSHFPLDPTYSKVIISAPQYKCLEEVLDLVSILSTENIFCDENSNNRDQAVVQHSKFKSNLGDHFTLLNVFSQFKNHRENKVSVARFLPQEIVNRRDYYKTLIIVYLVVS